MASVADDLVVMPPPPRIAAPTPREFEKDWLRPGRPAIFTGAMDHWPARRTWSIEHFRRTYGTDTTAVAWTDEGRLARDPRIGIRYGETTVDHALDEVLATPRSRAYLVATLETQLPRIAREVEPPAYCRGRARLRSRLWISARDTVSPLHRDFPHNLFAQVYGRKRFTILSPRENRRVDEHSFRSKLPRVSSVDAEAPDFVEHPRFRGARVSTFELGPGDLLFLPGRWWHQVRSLETSISINWWWATGLTRLLVTAADIYKRARSVRL